MRTIQAVRTLKRSIDARQRTVFVNLTVRIYINELPTDDEYTQTYYPMVDDGPAVVVVGAGPGGLFAALRLIELGCRPIVVERGKDVHTRKRDIARISREHTPCILVPSPNVTNNHQEKNARVLEQGGGAVVVLEKDCSAEKMYALLKQLLSDEEKLAQMSHNLRKMVRLDSTERICDIAEELIRK